MFWKFIFYSRVSYRRKKNAQPADSGSLWQEDVQYLLRVGSTMFRENMYYI